MAGTNGHPAPGETGVEEFIRDLDALAPESRHVITFEGTRYPVRHVLDLPIADWLTLLRLEAALDAANGAGETARALGLIGERLALLIPTLPAEIAQRMTYRQAFAASSHAWAIARKDDPADPRRADAAHDSSSGSPASAVSSGGGPETRSP